MVRKECWNIKNKTNPHKKRLAPDISLTLNEKTESVRDSFTLLRLQMTFLKSNLAVHVSGALK